MKLRFRLGPVTQLHGALENGADLRVNERQKIRHYCARSTEERRIEEEEEEGGEIAIFLLHVVRT